MAEERQSINQLLSKFLSDQTLDDAEKAEIRMRIGAGDTVGGGNVETALQALAQADVAQQALIADLQSSLDDLNYVPPVITTFTSSVTEAEIGSTITNPVLSWSVSKTLNAGDGATVALNQGIGLVPVTNTTYTHVGTFNADRTYTLTVDDGSDYAGHSVSRSVAIAFKHKLYWGVSTKTGETGDLFTSADILALATKVLSTSKVKQFTITGGGKYLVFASPVSLGDVTFTVGGFVTTFIRKTVSFQNASGHVADFYVYRSEFVQNGTNIPVSTN